MCCEGEGGLGERQPAGRGSSWLVGRECGGRCSVRSANLVFGSEPQARDMNEYVYQYNDVFVTAGNTNIYQETIGKLSRGQSGFQQVIGTFAVRRLAGCWPRAVNLWESTWADLAAALPRHDPRETPAE